jgi:hypothetical protein
MNLSKIARPVEDKAVVCLQGAIGVSVEAANDVSIQCCDEGCDQTSQ